ncbi:MAG: enoyl-CoA hydratase [Dehalococcoidia bacterium]
MSDLQYMIYEKDENIGVITLNRPETRNAQHEPFLRDLDAAYRLGEEDEEVKVIVLKANGPHFSSGHDLGTPESRSYREKHPIKPGVEGRYRWESKFYLGLTRRWRDIPKPTIAAVQGYCIAGGLMLCWPCDIIIAADNAKFSDPVVRMGIGGVEYFAHPWEFGARKAKELLFTGEFIDAEEAHRLGMVNKVVPLDSLIDETMAMARKIAEMPAFALALTKQAVNQTMDAMGQRNAMEAVFTMHQLAHAHSELSGGSAVMGMDAKRMKAASGLGG